MICRRLEAQRAALPQPRATPWVSRDRKGRCGLKGRALLSGFATLEVGVHRSHIAASETPRRPRGLPRVSYRVWSVSTDRSRDGKGWRSWDPCEAESPNLSGTSVLARVSEVP